MAQPRGTRIPTSPWRALTLAGSTLYAGGDFSTIAGQTRSRLASFDTATGVLTSFNPQFAGETINAVAVLGSTVYAGGRFTSEGSAIPRGVAAVNATSGAQAAWDPHVGGAVLALAGSGSSVYVGGTFAGAGPPLSRLQGLVRLRPGGALDTSWNARIDGFVSTIAMAETTMYVGGSFTHAGGQARDSLAALNLGDANATGWAPARFAGGNVSRIVYAGSFVVFVAGWGGGYRVVSYLGGQSTTFWDVAADSVVNDLALSETDDTLYVGGAFGVIGGQARKLIAAIDFNFGTIEAWNAGAGDGNVLRIRPAGTVLYVGGVFNAIGGQSRANLAALNASTGLATDANPGADSAVYDFLVHGSTLYTAGGFSTVAGVPRRSLAALDVGAGLSATEWQPDPDDAVRALDRIGSTLLIGGHFTAAGRRVAGSFAQLDLNAPETTLDAGPTGVVRERSQQFAFSSTKPGSTFACTLDSGAPASCTSPWQLAGLSDGPHTVKVAATDPTALADKTPATLAFTVDGTPPDTSILGGTPSIDAASQLTFTATESGATFACSLDGAAFAACPTPFVLAPPAAGQHTFSVRATDRAGNVDPTPAVLTFTTHVPDAPADPQTPTPTPTPQATTPRATPTPEPVARPKPNPLPSVLSIPFQNGYQIGSVSRKKGCRGKLTLELKLGKRVLDRRSTKLDGRCRYKVAFRVKRTQVGSAKRLTVVVRFHGNRYLGKVTNRFTLPVSALKRRRRSALATTLRLESAIARPAITGLSRPTAASGIAATL